MTALQSLHEIAGELDSWRPQDLNDLPEQPPTPPQLGNTHLVYPGKRHVFSGPPESAKTLAAYCVLIQIARTDGTGILLDFEMGAYDARQRLRELGATPAEISRIVYVEPDERANTGRIETLINLGPDLVVIDAAAGIYSLEGLDDNKRGDVEKISNLYIRAFWRAGIATILIDHVVKDGEARGRYAIGSERKLGGADVHLGFEVVGKQAISRGGKGKYKISTHKDRGGYLKRGHLADLHLTSDPDTHAIEWKFTEPEPASTDEKGHHRNTIKMEQISRELEGVTEPLSKAEVKRRVGGNSERCGQAIETMIREGILVAGDGPRGSINVTLARPYRRAEDPLENRETEGQSAPVLVLFSSCSETGDRLTCSPVPGVYTPEQVEQPSSPPQNTPENTHLFPQISGWFTEDGQLDEGRAAWLESMIPDDDEQA